MCCKGLGHVSAFVLIFFFLGGGVGRFLYTIIKDFLPLVRYRTRVFVKLFINDSLTFLLTLSDTSRLCSMTNSSMFQVFVVLTKI